VSYLLDTNSFVEHMRHGAASNVTQRLLNAPPGSIHLCSVVVAELIYGAIRSGHTKEAANRSLIAGIQARFGSLPFDDAAAEEYGSIRAHLASVGTPIGPNDLMIAAITLANKLTLVTANTAEFGRVPGLHLENWQ
jgi:tRNA(fMet)-specific endonuclease VapC